VFFKVYSGEAGRKTSGAGYSRGEVDVVKKSVRCNENASPDRHKEIATKGLKRRTLWEVSTRPFEKPGKKTTPQKFLPEKKSQA